MRMILMLNRTGRLLLLMVGTSVALAGCSGATGTQGDGRMTVVASIYPLQYVVEQVGGDLVAVSTVTPAAPQVRGSRRRRVPVRVPARRRRSDRRSGPGARARRRRGRRSAPPAGGRRRREREPAT